MKSPFPKVGPVRALKLLAEGLDPSKKKPESKLEKQYKEHWHTAHLHYRLSKVVTNPTSKVMTNLNRLQLKAVTDAVSDIDGIARHGKKRFEKKGVKEFDSFCADYELNWILENRHIFYQVGW